MKNAKEFLDLCRRRFPSPRKDQRHCLTLEGDTLVLTLVLGHTCQRFNLDNEDLSKPATVLLAELTTIFKKAPKKPPTPPKSTPDSIA